MDRRLVGWIALWAAATGCQDNNLGVEQRHANRPPETTITSRPQAMPRGTEHRVHLYWIGYDSDGRIDHYDFILVDHPAVGDPAHGIDSLMAGQFAGRFPSPTDPRWSAIENRDSVFVARADSLPRPPLPGPGETDEFVRQQSFQRWHTFFVRAVDNEGLADPTPDFVSFNATTLAPTVELLAPVTPGHEFQAPGTIVFQWRGLDPDGGENGMGQAPLASRWALMVSRRDATGEYVGFPESLYARSTSWSPWRAWNAADGSGKRVVVQDLQATDPDRPGTGFYVFAVQAMDDAGAVTPVFDDRTAHKNNAVTVFVSGFVGPTLRITDRFLGSYDIIGSSQPMAFDIASQQPIRMRWSADASSYGGSITGYRWGWDIRDLDDDSLWEQGWSATATSAPERVFATGAHRFYVDVRDDAGSVTRAVIELTVHSLTRRRTVLLVDDTTHQRPDQEVTEDRRWAEVLGQVALDGGFAFDPVQDVYEVHSTETQNLPPPLPLTFDYRAIVWAVMASSNGAGLRALASFYDPFLPVNASRIARYNYLNAFIDNGGCLWVCGAQPANLVWPFFERPRGQNLPPFNVTNWNLDQHPDIDSVGVASFLYRMGIEAYDLGNGGRAPAPRLDHLEQGCLGLRRAEPQDSEARRFTAHEELGHSHEVTIATADVEARGTDSVRYTTSLAADHGHELELGPADFALLRSGARITRRTSVAVTPAPHTHEFDVEDAIALWGAPPRLEPGDSWSLPPDRTINPLRSRPNVEIYDMPRYLATQTPQLRPTAGLTMMPYLYSSAVEEGMTPQTHYPLTADGQPALVLRRWTLDDWGYRRAFCGFEPWLLQWESHRRLTEYILVHQMHVLER